MDLNEFLLGENAEWWFILYSVVSLFVVCVILDVWMAISDRRNRKKFLAELSQQKKEEQVHV